MVSIIKRLSNWGARFTRVLLAILATILATSILISIFFRYVVGQALSWPEEVSLLVFTWLVLLGGSLGVHDGFHVRLTLLTSKLPAIAGRCLDCLTTLGIGTFGAVLCFSGIDFIQRTSGNLSATLRYPLDWLNYSAPVCGTLIVIHALNNLLNKEKEQ